MVTQTTPHGATLLSLVRGGFLLSSAWFVWESAPTAIPSCLAEREVLAYIQINKNPGVYIHSSKRGYSGEGVCKKKKKSVHLCVLSLCEQKPITLFTIVLSFPFRVSRPVFVRFAFLRERSRPGAPKPTAEHRKPSGDTNPEVEHHYTPIPAQKKGTSGSARDDIQP